MNITNDEEAISFFNRLLGSLHQADYSFKGSIQLVYVAKGAQHCQGRAACRQHPNTERVYR